MFFKRYSRALSIILAMVMLLTVAAPAFAQVSPNTSQERLNKEVDAVVTSLDAFFGEDSEESEAKKDEKLMNWLEIFYDFEVDANTALDRFIESMNNKDCIDAYPSPVKSDIFYMYAVRTARMYGLFRKFRTADEAKERGAFNLNDGRFYVDYHTNTYEKKLQYGQNYYSYFPFECTDYFPYYYYNFNQNRINNINKNDVFVGSIDVAEGKNHLFIQVAFPEEYDANKCSPDFDVYRIMIGNGRLRMSSSKMSESTLQKNRVKSAYMSWESFRLSSVNLLEFDGETLRFVDNGAETIYISGGAQQTSDTVDADTSGDDEE